VCDDATATSQAGFRVAIKREGAPRAAIGRRVARPANRGPRAGQGRLMSSDPIRRRRQLKEMRDQSRRE